MGGGAEHHLGCCGAGDEGSSGVLDLHFIEEGLAVLGELDVTRARNKHLQGTLGADCAADWLRQPRPVRKYGRCEGSKRRALDRPMVGYG